MPFQFNFKIERMAIMAKQAVNNEIHNYESKQHVLSEYRDLLSVEDLSRIFDVSKNTIYKSIQEGEFGTPIRIGRAYKVPRIFIINKFFNDYK